MAWMKSMKFKNRIIVSLIVFALYGGLLFVFDWHRTGFQCFRFFNQSTPTEGSRLYHQNYTPFEKLSDFSELEMYVRLPRDPKNPAPFEKIIIRSRFYEKNTTFAEILNHKLSDDATSGEKFQYSISKEYLYKENDTNVRSLLYDMSTLTIANISNLIISRQLKLTVTFSNGMQALFKPQRVLEREKQIEPDQFWFQDIDRHNSEIAAFHLDRILNFRRVMPTIGRRINLTTEMVNKTTPYLNRLFFWLPSNNFCFWINYTTCSFYCDIFDPICGQKDILEGSFAAYLPKFDGGELLVEENPYRKIPHFVKPSPWEIDTKYCDNIKKNVTYSQNNYRRLLDLVDMGIFDFLIGNVDRPHYDFFRAWNNDSTLIYLDNARGFGKAFKDEIIMLAPLYQCCMVRDTTLRTLLSLHNGPKPLSELMRDSLSEDPVSPILWEPYYTALDRRVQKILDEVRKCLKP